MRASGAIVLCIGLAVAGCGSSGDETNGAELNGVARIGQEDWSFQVCGTSDRWNISVDAIEKGPARHVKCQRRACSRCVEVGGASRL
jgi:hypothetical protein